MNLLDKVIGYVKDRTTNLFICARAFISITLHVHLWNFMLLGKEIVFGMHSIIHKSIYL
jgi:hypothetical protein